jgi:hypothetical protein
MGRDYDHYYTQFLNANVDISFSDWLVDSLNALYAHAENRVAELERRVDRFANAQPDAVRIRMLEEQIRSLSHQLDFERHGRMAAQNPHGVPAPPPIRPATAPPPTRPATVPPTDPRFGTPIDLQDMIDNLRATGNITEGD